MQRERRLIPGSMVERDDDLVVQELDEEIVMANLETGRYFGLGEVARQIWLILDRPRPVTAICSELRGRYDVDPDICERDVLAFLDELMTQGIVREAVPGEGAFPH